MTNKKARFENMLFDYETSNRTSYQGHEILPEIKTIFKKKENLCLMVRPPPLKDIHTLTNWKKPVAFTLLLQPKTNDPSIAQKPYSRPLDPDREKVQATRPRIFMTPAVSMDDITDNNARKLFCDSMYTSDMTRANREAVSDYFSVRAPIRDHPAPGNPIVLGKLREPMVSPEWRMDSMKWDGQLLRSHCEATKEFWLRRAPPVCIKCDESAVVTANKKMTDQMRRARY